MKFKPTMEQKKEIGEFLRTKRGIKGLTQHQVAQRAGICQRLYGRFECCERYFLTARFKTVMRVLDALDINAKEFTHKYMGNK